MRTNSAGPKPVTAAATVWPGWTVSGVTRIRGATSNGVVSTSLPEEARISFGPPGTVGTVRVPVAPPEALVWTVPRLTLTPVDPMKNRSTVAFGGKLTIVKSKLDPTVPRTG